MDRYVSLLESVKERARDLQIYTDEGIRQIIFEKVKSASDLSLRDRVRIGKRIFNSIRRMDILQPLLDDDEVTDIMVNGAERIFYTRRGQMLQYEDCFESEERLEDLIQQIVGSVNRIVNPLRS